MKRINSDKININFSKLDVRLPSPHEHLWKSIFHIQKLYANFQKIIQKNELRPVAPYNKVVQLHNIIYNAELNKLRRILWLTKRISQFIKSFIVSSSLEQA